MKKVSKGRTKLALTACLLTVAIAMPAWSDTLVLRDGTTIPGTLIGATTSTITFRGRRGDLHRYSVNDVDSVQFGDAPEQSRGSQAPYGQPPDNRPPDDRDNRNGPGYGNPDNRNNDNQAYGNPDNPGNPPNGNQDSGGYDQARMERVVVPAGAEIAVRTNERIDSHDVVEGQTFSAQIAEDVRGSDGLVAIPRGSDAKLITRRLENNGDITLDIQSVEVAGRRYRVSTEDQELQSQRRDGVGANKRTGKFVGGGAAFGAIIGAIAGGGKGAAIGAVAGAGAGAGAEIITQGKEVHVPAETVLRFHLDNPLRLHLWS